MLLLCVVTVKYCCVCVHAPVVIVVVIRFHCLFIMNLESSYDVVSLNDIDPKVCIVLQLCVLLLLCLL